MKYKACDIKINIDVLIHTHEREAIISKLKLNENEVKNFCILRSSLDCRYHKSTGIYRIYTVSFDYPHPLKDKRIKKYTQTEENRSVSSPAASADIRPIIIGAGPAGLFCALRFRESGVTPIIIEQGKDIAERSADINRFFESGILDTDSNIQFGLGGAGTFSDGKLMSRIKNPLTHYVAQKFIDFGADASIKYLAKPHLGTDNLKKIISGIKTHIENSGGRFLFSSKATDIIVNNGRVISAVIGDADEIPCTDLILAIGNASRDTYQMLYEKGAAIVAKPFSVGVRVEHAQEIIDRYMYGSYAQHPRLGAAEYQLVYKDTAGGRSVYSFCNCPGGYVVNSTCGAGQVSTNGMSFSRRNAKNANAAIVVNINTTDFGDAPFSGVYFQRKLEEDAYNLAKGGYLAPAMHIDDFIGAQAKSHAEPSIKPGVCYCDIRQCLPQFVTDSLKNALSYFCSVIEDFDTGVMTAPETRTSSPVRIVRNAQTMQSVTIEHLYPAGEGAGYAGGIMSSAVDGVEVANRIMHAYNNDKVRTT
jgi:uncharacterized FAD-dependent dehydrogenase